MTRAPQKPMQISRLASLLCRTVSHGAQETRLSPLFIGFRLEVNYVATREDLFLGTVLQGDPAMRFLARVKMWLTFLFTGRLDVGGAPRPQRLLRHAILKHWGYKRLVQWLYNRTLISRVRWCWPMFSRRVRARP